MLINVVCASKLSKHLQHREGKCAKLWKISKKISSQRNQSIFLPNARKIDSDGARYKKIKVTLRRRFSLLLFNSKSITGGKSGGAAARKLIYSTNDTISFA